MKRLLIALSLALLTVPAPSRADQVIVDEDPAITRAWQAIKAVNFLEGAWAGRSTVIEETADGQIVERDGGPHAKRIARSDFQLLIFHADTVNMEDAPPGTDAFDEPPASDRFTRLWISALTFDAKQGYLWIEPGSPLQSRKAITRVKVGPGQTLTLTSPFILGHARRRIVITVTGDRWLSTTEERPFGRTWRVVGRTVMTRVAERVVLTAPRIAGPGE